MYYTYILKSSGDNSFYYSLTKNLLLRLKEHNASKVKYTKGHCSWIIHYYEEFDSRIDAVKRELFFKSIDGYKWLKEMGIT